MLLTFIIMLSLANVLLSAVLWKLWKEELLPIKSNKFDVNDISGWFSQPVDQTT